MNTASYTKLLSFISLILLVLSPSCVNQETRSSDNVLASGDSYTGDMSLFRDSYHFKNIVAVSLRNLQDQLYDYSRDKEKWTHVKEFFGITNIHGFFLDKENDDIILWGEEDPGKPRMSFDDFVVSLRNAYELYAKKEGNTIYYSNPSCTIDPDPATIQQLGPKVRNNQRNEYIELCKNPQAVKVFGLPHTSHAAAVIVEGDYVMKDLSNGNISLPIPGFHSMTRMHSDIANDQMKKGGKVTLGNRLNRFWFTSGGAFFRCNNSENMFYLLDTIPIVLKTENEMVSGNSIQGSGEEDTLALKFARSFTTHYRSIADSLSIYKELYGTYRCFALAKALKESGAVDESFLKVLLQQYPLDEYQVPEELPGRYNISCVTNKKGNSETYFYLYSCGGVDLGTNIILRRSEKKPEEEEYENLMQNIKRHRANNSLVEWRVSEFSWGLYINLPCFFLN